MTNEDFELESYKEEQERIRIEELQTLCICSERYALGRRTYMVSNVVDIIKSNIDNLTPKTIKVITMDIEEARDLGDDCDKAKWMELLNLLKKKDKENSLQNDSRLWFI